MVVYRCEPFNSVARRLRLLVTPRCTMALPTLKWYLYVSLLEDIVIQYTENQEIWLAGLGLYSFSGKNIRIVGGRYNKTSKYIYK